MLRSIAVVSAAALFVSACGGDDDASDDATRTDVTSADDGRDADGNGAADEDGGGRDAGNRACPLTAEQVGGVLGREVTADEASCTFYPADDSLLPNANYVAQFDLACGEEVRAEAGYEESVEGVGAEAYVQPGTAIGTLLLVCAGGSPFEITVDSETGDDAEQAAAEDLARLVLSSR